MPYAPAISVQSAAKALMMKKLIVGFLLVSSTLIQAQEAPEGAKEMIKSLYTEALGEQQGLNGYTILYGNRSSSKWVGGVKRGGTLCPTDDVECWGGYGLAAACGSAEMVPR